MKGTKMLGVLQVMALVLIVVGYPVGIIVVVKCSIDEDSDATTALAKGWGWPVFAFVRFCKLIRGRVEEENEG